MPRSDSVCLLAQQLYSLHQWVLKHPKIVEGKSTDMLALFRPLLLETMPLLA